MGTNETPPNAIRLDPAVDAAKRLMAHLNDGNDYIVIGSQVNDDIVTMAAVILKLAGHQIVDKTKTKPKPNMVTEYNIRLKSGRIVEPGPGGFYWLASSGRQLGGVHHADWVAREMAVEALGGVCVANVFGRFESITEFIPIESIESIVKRVDASGCVCGGAKHVDGGCLCGATPKTSP